MSKKYSLALKRILLLPVFIASTLLVVLFAPILFPAFLFDFAFDTDYKTDILFFAYKPADIVSDWMELDIP